MTTLPSYLTDTAYREQVAARLLGKVALPADIGECWPWLGAPSKEGYGRFKVDGKDRMAHRVMYEITHGPVPADLVTDHLCRNRICVNPMHIEIVTNAVNVLRGIRDTGRLSLLHQTDARCRNGHDPSIRGIYRTAKGYPVCRACKREASQRFRARASQAA